MRRPSRYPASMLALRIAIFSLVAAIPSALLAVLELGDRFAGQQPCGGRSLAQVNVAAVSGWEIAIVGAGGAILGALVGGLLSFSGIVYSSRRQRDALKRQELLDGLSAYTFATDLFAGYLEALPPNKSGPAWSTWVDRWVLGGDRGVYLFGRLLEQFLFPAMSNEVREFRERYYEASGRLGLIGPPELLDVSRRMTRFLLEWQDSPDPARLREFGQLRLELTDVARQLLGADAIEARAAVQIGQ